MNVYLWSCRFDGLVSMEMTIQKMLVRKWLFASRKCTHIRSKSQVCHSNMNVQIPFLSSWYWDKRKKQIKGQRVRKRIRIFKKSEWTATATEMKDSDCSKIFAAVLTNENFALFFVSFQMFFQVLIRIKLTSTRGTSWRVFFFHVLWEFWFWIECQSALWKSTQKTFH